ncbi:MAG: chromate transporter [Oscillospiraceae bacterium]|nr:chromate transporter [Oscillospiraceae bacterium]
MIYLRLLFEFFKAGLFTVGGGLAALPFLEDIAVKTGWFSVEQLTDMIAISESTPGPIGINMATYAGFTTGGIFGSIVATLGFMIPSVIIITIVSKFIQKFNENKIVKGAFYGLRAASVALISTAAVNAIGESVLFDLAKYQSTGSFLDLISIPGLILAVVAFIVLKKWNPHPIFILAGSAVVGIVLKFAGV